VEELFEHILRKADVLFWTGEQILDWYVKARQPLERATGFQI
jgi:hypothetical protein